MKQRLLGESRPYENTRLESSLNSDRFNVLTHVDTYLPTWTKHSQVILKQKREVLSSGHLACLALFFLFSQQFLCTVKLTLSGSWRLRSALACSQWYSLAQIHFWVPPIPGYHPRNLGHIPNWKTKDAYFYKRWKSKYSSFVYLHFPGPQSS